MSVKHPLFTADYRAQPYWWEAFAPPESGQDTLPVRASVVVVGGGYAGVCCALTLAQAGVDVLVLEAGRLGQGASTRSGGQVTGGVNVQKKALAKGVQQSPDSAARMTARLRDTAQAMTYVETLIAQHAIDCGWHKTGRITGLWLPQHYEQWAARLPTLNTETNAQARMMDAAEVKTEVGTDAYHGAALIGRAGHLHPAKLYGGMLAAARAAGARLMGDTPVTSITRHPAHYTVQTDRGSVHADQIVIATNGYTSSITPELKRGIVPITSQIIATEPLSPDLVRSILPTNRAVSETRRVVNYYRLSPDGTRLLFGGRARFVATGEETTARLLYNAMTFRFPQLKGTRLTHSWSGNVAMTLDQTPHIGSAQGLHYALGCNGSGVAMMSYLGHSVARKIIRGGDAPINAFDMGELPSHPLYFGRPWFLFAIGSWYQFRDAFDHWRAQRRT
ncbi:MAG: FAD-binding oxidoreductase [Burkholderiaceae bacterium]